MFDYHISFRCCFKCMNHFCFVMKQNWTQNIGVLKIFNNVEDTSKNMSFSKICWIFLFCISIKCLVSRIHYSINSSKTRRKLNTTWFFHFLMVHYKASRWIKHFRITWYFVDWLIIKLKQIMEKKHTSYKCAIHVSMNMYYVCFLYKLVHCVEYLHCNEILLYESL